jgi:hypothetical protein
MENPGKGYNCLTQKNLFSILHKLICSFIYAAVTKQGTHGR